MTLLRFIQTQVSPFEEVNIREESGLQLLLHERLNELLVRIKGKVKLPLC